MAENEADPLYDQLQALIGSNVSKAGEALDPVNMPMIRRWTDAFGDRNPVYEDADAAAQTRHGDVIAPPAMMPVWAMSRPKLENLDERGGLTVDIDPDSPLITLDKAGYMGSLATNSAFEFIRPLRLGDVLTSEAILESVSPRKRTALGLGYFVTWITNYTDQDGQLVGLQRFTLFKFDPSTMGA